MSAFPQTPGAPNLPAASASLSLSGLDDFAPLDTDIMETEWYHSQDHYHHPSVHAQSPLSPGHEHFAAASVGFSYPSPNVPVSEDAFGALQYSSLDHPMNGHSYPQYAQDGVSPLQPQYSNAYQTPYPDSTASSAPSEDPIVADAEEDKRKRNQAASARFRQKKKQREQQMMEQSRDMQEKNKRLEGEVEGLKRENTFLKKLLVEKIDNMTDEDKALLAKTTGNLGKKKD